MKLLKREYGEELRGTPRYLKESTWSRLKGGMDEEPWNTVLPVAASYVIILDLVSDRVRWWLEKKALVFVINWSRAVLDDPIKIISSAKRREDTLSEPRSIPRPVELSSWPRLFMKREKRRGLKLQPIKG